MASCIGSTVMPSPEKLFRGSPTVATADAVGVRKVDARRFPVVSRSAPHRRPGLAGWEAQAVAPWLRLGWSSRSDEMNADCSCPSSAGVLSNGNLLVAVAAFAQLSPPRVHQMSSARRRPRLRVVRVIRDQEWRPRYLLPLCEICCWP